MFISHKFLSGKALSSLGLSIMILGGSSVASGQAQAAAKPAGVTLRINGNLIESGEKPFLDANGSVYVPLRTVSSLLQSVVDWDAKQKLVSIYAPEHTVKLKLNSKTLQHNGKTLPLSMPVKLKNNTVYVPIRFISQTLGAEVNWQSKTQTVNIEDGGTYVWGWSYSDTTAAFWLNTKNGHLYQSSPANGPAKDVGTLDYVKKEQPTLTAERIKDNQYMVSITDFYGEPHINAQKSTAYVNDGKLLGQATQYYRSRNAQYVTRYLNQPVLSNGKQVKLLNPDGSVDRQFDLTKIMGGDTEETYVLEGIGDGYLLVRPNKSGLLTLVDPDTGKSKQLYELLSQEDQDRAHDGTPYLGDMLQVSDGPDRSVIYLNNRDEKHPLQVKVKDWLS